MTKKPPKTLWVNVYKSLYDSTRTIYTTYPTKENSKECAIVDDFYIGTFKYVLAEGKK